MGGGGGGGILGVRFLGISDTICFLLKACYQSILVETTLFCSSSSFLKEFGVFGAVLYTSDRNVCIGCSKNMEKALFCLIVNAERIQEYYKKEQFGEVFIFSYHHDPESHVIH